MTSNNHSRNRALQQEARAWAENTGCSYTAALRQMQSPLAQGFLGEPVSARKLFETLMDHPVIGAEDGAQIGEGGLYSRYMWDFDPETGYIEMALITDMLRMFSPLPDTESPKIGSYSLKHTAEALLSETPASYVTNGRLMWAAATLGLPIAEYDHEGGPNVLIGIPENEYEYVYKMVRRGQTRPQAHHYRPPGYEHLQTALAQVLADQPVPARWVHQPPVVEPAPFHDWLLLQAGRDEPIGDFAGDYAQGVRTSEHRLARTPDELLRLLIEIPHSPEAYDAARAAVGEWLGTMTPSPGIRTEWLGSHREETDGHGAGSGNIERLEYRCPCGNGRIVEQHDNIPGFRDHTHWIECDQCRAEWRFLEGRSISDWALEPVL